MGRQIVCCAKGVAFSRSRGILGSEKKKPTGKGLPMQKFDHVLLASDFDNTLVYTQSALDNGTDIPPMCPRNREALDYFIQNGGLFAISTGRALPAFMDYAKDVPMSAPCVIANGAAIYDFRANEYLYTAFLGEAIYDHMAEVLARFPTLAFEVYHDDCRIHAMNPNRYIRNHEHLTRSPVQVVERFADIDLPIIKILFEEDFPMLDAVRTFILRLASLLGVARKDIYCIGDHKNDIPMLEVSAVPFAPANAIPAVHEFGAHIVSHCSDGAVADVVEYLDKIY